METQQTGQSQDITEWQQIQCSVVVIYVTPTAWTSQLSLHFIVVKHRGVVWYSYLLVHILFLEPMHLKRTLENQQKDKRKPRATCSMHELRQVRHSNTYQQVPCSTPLENMITICTWLGVTSISLCFHSATHIRAAKLKRPHCSRSYEMLQQRKWVSKGVP